MPFKIVRNDITKMKVDAVVNTANEEPIYASGVDYAIYKAAGEEQLLADRRQIGHMEEGEVAITKGYRLPAKYIIHAVSPLYIDGESGEEEKLRRCYRQSLQLACENKCESIAFPLISTGGFGYPKEEGMRIAVDEINAFLLTRQMLVYLVVFDAAAVNLGRNLYPDLKSYIDQNYVYRKNEEEYGYGLWDILCEDVPEYGSSDRRSVESKQQVPRASSRPMPREAAISSNRPMPSDVPVPVRAPISPTAPSPYEMPFSGDAYAESAAILDCQDLNDSEYEEYIEEKEHTLKERMKHMTDTFQEYLFYLIEQKALNHVEVYKRAIIDKRQFSKIKKNPDYHPDKATALRLCVGARLNLDETKDLLARAGYALSPCDMRDIIFSYFIERQIYDATEIDITLEEHGLQGFIM